MSQGLTLFLNYIFEQDVPGCPDLYRLTTSETCHTPSATRRLILQITLSHFNASST